MKRESWKSQTGFIIAAVGSAIGLANIVRFPYLVGQNGGAAFLFIYLISLLVMGFPVFLAEVLIGRTTQRTPAGAFRELGAGSAWQLGGKMTVLTGFLVSSFYSALAGWILGYFVEALKGELNGIATAEHASLHYEVLISTWWWGVLYHLAFISICTGVVYFGVRKGIEKGCEFMMPVLFCVLLYLVGYGLFSDGAGEALGFLFKPNWSSVTPTAVLLALGQSFFTISVGQGTMITYGSYLSKNNNLVKMSIPIILADTVVSILASIAVFTIVFSAGMEPSSGLGLLFHTLPVVFGKISAGHLIAVFFFLLVVLAALTSEISAMEPSIAYLIDEWKWSRHRAVVTVGSAAAIIGLPCALSYSLFKEVTLAGFSILELFDFICTSVLIPLGGLMSVIFLGWRWGIANAWRELKEGQEPFFDKNGWLKQYLTLSYRYIVPMLIVLVFLSVLGVI